MEYKSSQKPSSYDASDFLKLTESLRFVINRDDVAREKVKAHKFYAWLVSTAQFPRISPHLKKKHLTGEFPYSVDIQVARCVAMVYISYCEFSSHPDQLIRTTQATSEKALKHINALAEMCNADLQMESYLDSVDLKRLLDKLKRELMDDIPTTYPRSSRGDLLGKRLVIAAHQYLEIIFGEAPTFVTCQLVSTVYEVTSQQVRRYTKKIKQSVKPHI